MLKHQVVYIYQEGKKKEHCIYLPGKFFFETSCLTKATEKIIINLLQKIETEVSGTESGEIGELKYVRFRAHCEFTLYGLLTNPVSPFSLPTPYTDMHIHPSFFPKLSDLTQLGRKSQILNDFKKKPFSMCLGFDTSNLFVREI